MKSLKYASPFGFGKDEHHHIVFLDDMNKVGAVTASDGHTHEVVWQDYQAPQYDQMGQEISPEVQEGWFVKPSLDGHTHQITEYPAKIKKKKTNETEAVREVVELYREARGLEQESFDLGKEAEDFYWGDQWSSEEKNYLEALDRACLTINVTQREVNALSGEQRQNRTDIRYLPVEGGDQRACDMINVVAKQILTNCFYEREESKIFRDVLVPGRGNYNLWVDFNSDLRGVLKVEQFPWDQIWYGPHDKEDLSDCEYVIKEKMYSAAKIEQLWPKKAKSIQRDLEFYRDSYSGSEPHVRYNDDQYAHSDNRYPMPLIINGTEMVGVAKKEFRVLECWRRIYERVVIAASPTEDFYPRLDGWKDEDVDAVGTLPGFVIVDKTVPKIRITKIAGSTLLSDENPAELPVDDFFVVPVYCYKRGNQYQGKVQAIKDPQREINKRRSQAIDIGNKMVSYLWFTDPTTFPDSQAKEKFKRNATSPGAIVEISNINQPPQKVEGTKFPAELVNLMQMDEQFVVNLMNASVEKGGANESASLFMQRVKSAMKSNEFLYDNLRFAKQKVGKLLLSLIQRYYPADRIYRIVNNMNMKEPVMLGDQPFDQFEESEIVELLENTDITEFDVVVSESPTSATTQLTTFFLLSDLAKNGVPVPPEALVESAELPDFQKNKLKTLIAQQMQGQAQAQSETQATEIKKTLIAQGYIPPEVQQQFGIQAPATPMQEPTSEVSPEPMPSTQVPQPGGVGEGGPSFDIASLMEREAMNQREPAQPVVVNINMPQGSSKKVVRLQTDPVTGQKIGTVDDVPPVEVVPG